MKIMRRFLILFFCAISSVPIFADNDLEDPESYKNFDSRLTIDDNNDFTRVYPTQKWLAAVQTFRLYRDDADGFRRVYLAASNVGGSPFIFDSVDDGCAFEFKTFDINGDGKSELLVFYHCGGNAYVLQVYSIAEPGERQFGPSDLVKWTCDMPGSNVYNYINVKTRKIVTISPDSSIYQGIVIRTYKVDRDRIVLVSEEYSLGRDDATPEEEAEYKRKMKERDMELDRRWGKKLKRADMDEATAKAVKESKKYP